MDFKRTRVSASIATMLVLGLLSRASLGGRSRKREHRTPADVAERQAKQQAKLARRAARAHGNKA
ncbi:hypothetical protein P9A47_gp04 [Xanthomonas phage Elanor]|uniref:Uncharacterized protein n=1 Tax=Xanthomonas phage Elanor TaxID=2939127 RepID=A0A9E7J586_9CAUD|nr:hypothetical protein P9A47_gp04 [Xanthomonas phage Elanor]URA06972.1 hypothetical protein Elanor_BL4004 [Xanthomonas phage Elanor]